MMIDRKQAGKKMSHIEIMCGLLTTNNIKMALQHYQRNHPFIPFIPFNASYCELQHPFSIPCRKTLALKEHNVPREVIETDPRK